jgi:hypothetical protein
VTQFFNRALAPIHTSIHTCPFSARSDARRDPTPPHPQNSFGCRGADQPRKFYMKISKVWLIHCGQKRCPLYPRKRTSVEPVGMSALCHKRTHPLQQKLTYSITSSAAVSSLLDTVSPSILAVSALMISSNFVD